MIETLYRFFNADGELLYVGISSHLFRRLTEHQDQKPWVHEVDTIKCHHVDSRKVAEALEAQAISEEKPKYNVVNSRHRGREYNPSLVAELGIRPPGRGTVKQEGPNRWRGELRLGKRPDGTPNIITLRARSREALTRRFWDMRVAYMIDHDGITLEKLLSKR